MSKYKLGEIAEIQSGPFGTQLHKDEYVEFGIPMLNSKNVGSGDILVDSLDFVPQTVCERLPRYVLEEGDILFGRAGTIERHAYVTKKYDGAFQGTNCIRIRCKDKNKALYISYYLWKNELKQKIENMAGGSIQSYITTDLLKDIEVEIHGGYERIASLLAIIDKKIENNSAINDNLLATTQAIYKSWFVDFEPFDNVCPSDWGNGCVDDIAEFYDSMRKPLSSLERADMERIYPYYGAVSIVDYVDDFIFDGEYLLLSEDGIYVVDENGHPLLQHITGKFWANNHAHILKGKSGFNEDSLYLFLANTNMAPIVTGAAQPKINQANLKSFSITIPTSEVIENFNALIQPFFDQRLSNEAEVKKLESLKDLLLSRLVN